MNNYMTLKFKSISENESLARMAVATFISPLNPTLEDLADIKTSISEAVTNSIIHGYMNRQGTVEVTAIIEENILTVKIADEGVGISNIEEAREPLFTTKPELERSGMGFTIMESFMDTIEIISSENQGTTIIMTKEIANGRNTYEQFE